MSFTEITHSNASCRNAIRAGVVLVGLLCLASVSLQLRDAISSRSGAFGNDDISRFEKRFAPLKRALPPDIVVGYISEDNVDPESVRLTHPAPSAVSVVKERLLAEYTLYPVIIEAGTNHEYVVGNFHGRLPDPQAAILQNLRLVQDYGNGLMLFRSFSH